MHGTTNIKLLQTSTSVDLQLTNISGDSREGRNGFITQDIPCILQKPKFYSPND